MCERWSCLLLWLAVGAVARPAAKPETLRWEAEQLSPVGAKAETQYQPGASGGRYVFLAKGHMKDGKASAARFVARFSAGSGQAKLRVRALALNRGTDSFWWWIDGDRPRNRGVKATREWVWASVGTFLRYDGAHTLTIAAREPIRIDAVELVLGGPLAMQLRQTTPAMPEPNELRPVDINPPTFRWMGDWSRPYALQLARDRDFAHATTFESIHETFLRPREPLEPGRWFWRYRAGQDPWSRPVPFVVPDDAAKWPILAWDEYMAHLPKTHPRLWMRPEDLPALEAKARGPLQRHIAAWCKRGERNLGKPLPLEQDQQAQRHTDYQARTVQRVASKMAALRMMNPAGELAFLAMVTGRQDLADEATRRAMVAARLDPKAFTSHGVSDFANGSIVTNLARVYDYLHDRLSEDQRAAIRKAILARCFHYKPKLEQRLFSAHGWQHVVQDLTSGALAIYDEDERARQWLEWSLKMFVSLYPWWGGAEGGSAECVSYYLGTNMLTSLSSATFWKAAVGVDLAQGNPWYRANAWLPVYGHPLSGPMSQFGDHGAGYNRPSWKTAFAALRMADLHGNGHAAAYADAASGRLGAAAIARAFRGSNGILATLWMPFREAKREPLADLPPGRAFRDVGLVFLHSGLGDPTGNVMLEFRSSPYGSFNHAHADQNSFNIHAFGLPLIVDSGHYISYGDPHHYGWTIHTKAHNSILIDGKGQASRNLDAFGRIVDFQQAADWAYVAGDASAAYGDLPVERFLRHVVWSRGEAVQTYVVYDDVATSDGHAHRFDWLLHAAREMRVDEAKQVVDVFNERAQARVTFVTPAGMRFRQDNRFDPPAEKWRKDKERYSFPQQWHLTATPAQPQRAETFLVVIQVCARDQAEGLAPVKTGAEGAAIVGDMTVQIVRGRPQLQR